MPRSDAVYIYGRNFVAYTSRERQAIWNLIMILALSKVIMTWWRHQMETFSALLTICAGNSPVPGEFPTQRPVTRRFDVLFDLDPNKRLSKQSWGWWFETPSWSLWRHSNELVCKELKVIYPSPAHNLSTRHYHNSILFLYTTIVDEKHVRLCTKYIHHTGDWPGGRFKNTYELLNQRALKFSYVNKIHIFQCMGKIFCVEFQRYPLKFHTKYLTHTLKDMIFKQFWNLKSS